MGAQLKPCKKKEKVKKSSEGSTLSALPEEGEEKTSVSSESETSYTWRVGLFFSFSQICTCKPVGVYLNVHLQTCWGLFRCARANLLGFISMCTCKLVGVYVNMHVQTC